MLTEVFYLVLFIGLVTFLVLAFRSAKMDGSPKFGPLPSEPDRADDIRTPNPTGEFDPELDRAGIDSARAELQEANNHYLDSLQNDTAVAARIAFSYLLYAQSELVDEFERDRADLLKIIEELRAEIRELKDINEELGITLSEAFENL